MRKWFTARELAGLPGMPGTVQGLNLRAKREGWEARPRNGRGGGREYNFSSLPPKAQRALTKPEAFQGAVVLAADELVALRAVLDLALAEGWDVTRFRRVADKLLTGKGGDHA